MLFHDLVVDVLKLATPAAYVFDYVRRYRTTTLPMSATAMHLHNECLRDAMHGLRNVVASFLSMLLDLLRHEPMANQMQLRVKYYRCRDHFSLLNAYDGEQ